MSARGDACVAVNELLVETGADGDEVACVCAVGAVKSLIEDAPLVTRRASKFKAVCNAFDIVVIVERHIDVSLFVEA